MARRVKLYRKNPRGINTLKNGRDNSRKLVFVSVFLCYLLPFLYIPQCGGFNRRQGPPYPIYDHNQPRWIQAGGENSASMNQYLPQQLPSESTAKRAEEEGQSEGGKFHGKFKKPWHFKHHQKEEEESEHQEGWGWGKKPEEDDEKKLKKVFNKVAPYLFPIPFVVASLPFFFPALFVQLVTRNITWEEIKPHYPPIKFPGGGQEPVEGGQEHEG